MIIVIIMLFKYTAVPASGPAGSAGGCGRVEQWRPHQRGQQCLHPPGEV